MKKTIYCNGTIIWKIVVTILAVMCVSWSLFLNIKAMKSTKAVKCGIGQKLGCGNNCNKMCWNFFNGPVSCVKQTCLRRNKCDCDVNEGYYYDKQRGKCVPAFKCLIKPDESTTTASTTTVAVKRRNNFVAKFSQNGWYLS